MLASGCIVGMSSNYVCNNYCLVSTYVGPCFGSNLIMSTQTIVTAGLLCRLRLQPYSRTTTTAKARDRAISQLCTIRTCGMQSFAYSGDPLSSRSLISTQHSSQFHRVEIMASSRLRQRILCPLALALALIPLAT
jgi:hypothetical protein